MKSSTGSATTYSSSPEDGHFWPNQRRVGRDGRLELAFGHVAGRTSLVECRYQTPLQALAPLPLEDGSSYLSLLNPSGGVLAGDDLRTRIRLYEGAHAVLTTPSATRVYRSDGATARIDTQIDLSTGAILEYIPDHLIPHPGARIDQRLRLEVATDATAIVFDGFAAGRIARGERWQFHEFANSIEVYRGGVRLLTERMRLRPALQKLTGRGATDGFNYVGTVVIACPPQKGESTVCELKTLLANVPADAALSELSSSGWLVRVLARDAPSLEDTFRSIAATLRRVLLHRPPLDQRKF